MDPTTLVTFLFRAPPEARTVELLGSWDNFYQPYRMHNDRRRGAGFWSGCFKFHNIIFDGDKTQWTKPRTGGLKQGGTYWYYYRLDDDIEAYDDSKEHTTSCPLLPGQTLNVIEVPMEVERPCRSRSASFDVIGTLASLPTTHTLDPGDKFAAPDPPPISKVHARCMSDLALNGRLENATDPIEDLPDPRPTSSYSVPPPISSYSRHSHEEQTSIPTPGRFYAHGSYVDDRSSICSRRSWRSAAPSFSHSSVVDLYGVQSLVVEEGEPVSSLPAEDLRESTTDLHADASLEDAMEPSTATEHYEEAVQEDSETFSQLQEPQLPEDDTDGFDLCSPTYSAATISSNGGGVNTPHRLSSRLPSSDHAAHPDPGAHDNSIEHIAERLRSLGSLQQETSLPSPILEEADESQQPFAGYALPDNEGEAIAQPFTGYSLPSEVIQSTQSLGHFSSGKASAITSFIPPAIVMPEDQQETSLADSIFSELRFLD